MKAKITLSIIIVHYKATAELYDALRSIEKEKSKVTFEVIVVDNDEKIEFESDLKKKFSWVHYIKSPRNGGFGAGNNLGAKQAKGRYLFFLNPDTKIYPGSLDNLVNFLEQNRDAGIVAPLLLDPNEKPYPLQGTKALTPLSGAIALSFINKLFPTNPISHHYWQIGWDKTKQKEIDVVPGTAFMLTKKLYDELHGFDENFFLYFEEFDLCKRVRQKHYKIYIIPTAKVMHLWGRSTKHAKNINKIFMISRKYYFKKHYGKLSAWLVELLTTFDKQKALLLLILLIATTTRLYIIDQLMPFIGDQGWFYLSARDMVVTHQIPLVGITSSHTWLHQGPLWTYMLAPVLWLAQWNPLAGAYLSSTLGVISVYLIYIIGSQFFSSKIGLISAFLFATSPLIITSDRMPYHTAPIPLFILLLMYMVHKWLNGDTKALPWICFFLGILYNLELATAILWFVILCLLILNPYVTPKKNKIALSIQTKLLCAFAFFVPMLPMIIYDIHHGFPQTIKFPLWIGYKILSIFGFPPLHAVKQAFDLKQFLFFTGMEYQRFIYLSNGFVASIIFLSSTFAFYWYLIKKMKSKEYDKGLMLIGIWLTVSVLGYFAEKTASQAYLPMLFPPMIIMIAVSLDKIFSHGYKQMLLLLILVFIAITNIYSLVSQNYLIGRGRYGEKFSDKITVAQHIISLSRGHAYNLKGVGPQSEFLSFTMNYEYLTWWLGHGPTHTPQKTQVTIREALRRVELNTQ